MSISVGVYAKCANVERHAHAISIRMNLHRARPGVVFGGYTLKCEMN